MKKHAFWIYLGRGLIALISIIIISMVGIFVFDKYPTVKATYNQEDDYWTKLEGFSSYADLKANESKYDLASPNYESPFYDKDGNELSPLEKINAARYDEELTYVVRSFRDEITRLRIEKNNYTDVFKGSKTDWMFEVIGCDYLYGNAKSLYDALSNNGYKGSNEELTNMILNYQTTNIYKQIVARGYTGYFSTFVNALASASGLGSESMYDVSVENGYIPTSTDDETSRKEWIIDVAGFKKYTTDSTFSAYKYVVNNGYKGTKDNWLALVRNRDGSMFYTISQDLGYSDMLNGLVNDYNFFMAIYNDNGIYGSLKSVFLDAKEPNTEKINEIEDKLIELQDLINIASERKLGTLNDYKNRYQLLAENENYAFYMNLVLTTFKVVDKRTNYEWYSNPTTIDNPSLKSSQSTIISVYYGETGGALNEFSNYTYSTSSEESGSQVDPNFAVKIDKETNTIQVLYHMEKRSIDYTSIPKYFSAERQKQLLAQNKEIAALGKVDSTGQKIIDLETTLSYDKTELDNRLKAIDAELATSITEERKQELLNEKTEVQTKIQNFQVAYDIWGKMFTTWYNLKKGNVDTNIKDYDYYEYLGGGVKYENMSALVLKALYRYFYEWFGYTTAELAEDNAEFDMDIELNRVAFEIGIEYKLGESGLQVTVPGNSIREIGEYQICNIDILPYFTSTPKDVGGFTLIPDGSGSILEHDNGKANDYEPYIKRFYTTDLSQVQDVTPAESEDILLPMYAVVNNNSAVIVDIKTMAAQLELRATVSGYGTMGESNNKNYLRAYVRESQDVYIGTYSKEPVRKFTDKRLSEDITISYVFLANTAGENITYSDIAQEYRNILVERDNITSKDKTTAPVLDMNVIGAYTYTDNFMGFSYTAKGTMTTYEQLQTIIDEFKDQDVKYINVFYKGWRKEALVNTTFKKIKLNSLLGSKSQLKDLVENNDNVTIYPYVSLGQVNTYQESYGVNHYTTRDVIGEIIYSAGYDLNTNTFGKGRVICTISPHYYQAFAQSLVDSYVKLFGADKAKKNSININSISIDKFGSALSGDYKKNNEMFKFSAIYEQIKSLDIITKEIENVNLYQPYDFAFKYITHASDIPYQATRKELLDYSIPFYQLVVNGLFDYSGESINENIESGETYHLMRLIETGSNPQFTFTFDNSQKLIKTEYNNYYNTEYTSWISTVKTMFKELNDLGIYAYRLVKHERLEPNIYLVTYSNGTDSIKIILNYSFASYYYAVDGTTVSAKSYKKLN